MATLDIQDTGRRVKQWKANKHTKRKMKKKSNTDSIKIRFSEHNKHKFLLSLYIKGFRQITLEYACDSYCSKKRVRDIKVRKVTRMDKTIVSASNFLKSKFKIKKR